MTTREQFVQQLEAAETQRAWDSLCDQARRESGGHYPDWWFADVIASGLVARKGEQFSNPLRFTIDRAQTAGENTK